MPDTIGGNILYIGLKFIYFCTCMFFVHWFCVTIQSFSAPVHSFQWFSDLSSIKKVNLPKDHKVQCFFNS